MNMVYAVILWLTSEGAVTGIVEEILEGTVACEKVLVEVALKAAQEGASVLGKCVEDPDEVGRLIEMFSLVEPLGESE